MAEDLDLDAKQQARVRQVLDSLEAEIARAAIRGPDSLRTAAREALQRLERALPADRRSGFRNWMRGHNQRMMNEMQRWMGPMEDRWMEDRWMREPMMQDRGDTAEPWMRERDRDCGWDNCEDSWVGERSTGMLDRSRSGMDGRMMWRGMERGMGAASPPAIGRAQLPEPESQGAELLQRYCASCHGLPDPAAHTAGEWPATVERMRQYMYAAEVPAPDGAEANEIVRYLEAHGRK
jgi:hypothetical protein